MSKEATEQSGGTDGVELVETKSYYDERTRTEGVYTFRIYYIGGYVSVIRDLLMRTRWIPGWLKAILPASALRLEERAWNAYPYCKTDITSPFLGGRFQFTIESMHVENDWGKQENIHNLSPDVLKVRKDSVYLIGG